MQELCFRWLASYKNVATCIFTRFVQELIFCWLACNENTVLNSRFLKEISSILLANKKNFALVCKHQQDCVLSGKSDCLSETGMTGWGEGTILTRTDREII